MFPQPNEFVLQAKLELNESLKETQNQFKFMIIEFSLLIKLIYILIKKTIWFLNI